MNRRPQTNDLDRDGKGNAGLNRRDPHLHLDTLFIPHHGDPVWQVKCQSDFDIITRASQV